GAQTAPSARRFEPPHEGEHRAGILRADCWRFVRTGPPPGSAAPPPIASPRGRHCTASANAASARAGIIGARPGVDCASGDGRAIAPHPMRARVLTHASLDPERGLAWLAWIIRPRMTLKIRIISRPLI